MKTDLFHSCGHCWVFHICWHIECSTFRASSFRIRNSSAGIPSSPLALFILMTHSSVLAWRIPETGEPGGLPSMGSHQVGHYWSDLGVARPTWLHTSGCLAVGEWSHHCGYLGHEDLFCIVLLVFLPPLVNNIHIVYFLVVSSRRVNTVPDTSPSSRNSSHLDLR